ncbi:MAG: SDR family oxidoreductase [bacterium]
MNPKERFSGKVVWITGASSGIGEELAYCFVAEGAKVVISSNEDAELLRVKEKCGSGADVMALPLDLTEIDTFDAKMKSVLERFGKVDILINNGGISHRSEVKDTSNAVLRKVMDVDFTGHAALTHAVIGSMIEKKSGHIVVTSSLAGLLGIPTRAVYCAAKHALQGFFESLRAEVWRDGIKVTLICPAGVSTKIGYSSLMGDGGKYGKTDKHIEAGMSPKYVAESIVKAILEGREEVLLGSFGKKYPVYVARCLPSVYSWLLKRVKAL